MANNENNKDKDNEHLTKAKDSRDEIVEDLKEIESKMERMADKSEFEPLPSQDPRKIYLDELSQKIDTAKKDLSEIVKMIDERKGMLKSVEMKIVEQTNINIQQAKDRDALSEELPHLRQTKEDLVKEIGDRFKKDEEILAQMHSKQMEITVLSGDIKSKSTLLENLLKNTEDLQKNTAEQRKMIEINKKELDELEQKRANRQNELDFLNTKLTQIKDEDTKLTQIITEKEKELSTMKDRSVELKLIVVQNEEAFQKLKDEIDAKKKDVELKDDMIKNRDDQLKDIKLKQDEYDVHLNDLKATIDKTTVQKNSLDELITTKEEHLNNLNDRTAKLSMDSDRFQAKIAAAQTNLEKIQKEHEDLSSTNDLIEKNINESKKHVQNLKNSLDSQEKVIREKESRLHRIEVLSFLYKISKFFGGILMCIGLFYLIFGLGYMFNFIDFPDMNHEVIIYLTLIGAGFFLVSGIFQLEKL